MIIEKEDFSFDPEHYLFKPRPEIRPEFGNQEHVDLVKRFSKRIGANERVSLLLDQDGLCFYKASVNDICQKLRLSNLDINVGLLVSLGPGAGHINYYDSKNGIEKYYLWSSYVADNRLALDLLIKDQVWEKMKYVQGNSRFSTAQILTINHVFFHEMAHLKNPWPDDDQEAEEFALNRTRKIINGEKNLAAIWPVPSDF